jgi:glutamate-ammonia-ligase adenylyltransferase
MCLADAESDGAETARRIAIFHAPDATPDGRLSAPTAEGVLYEVDFRLRPRATRAARHVVSGFSKYQRNEAWTWEHQALCRARTVAGDDGLAREDRTELQEILALPRDRDKLKRDIVSMRARLLKDKPAIRIWDLKLAEGGLTDIDFIAQFLVLSGITKW